MMQYPSPAQYFSAVQHPERVFRTNTLKQAQLVLDPLFQTPQFASGNSAVVCKALVDGKEQALRFFIREDASSRDRYNALGEYFCQQKLVDCVATSTWLDDAIEISGRTWPVLQMEWVEGRTLDAYVNYLVEENDVGALSCLAESWRRLIGRLQAARFAHGDLQHGNVLVDETGNLRLVDFDASWIAPFSGRKPPSETGHPNYQRPDRPWGEWMDTFPGLLVYVSLLALSRDTWPWHKLYDQNNLLFQGIDFAPPYRTTAWQHLTSIADDRLNYLLALLKQCCAPTWSAEVRLEELLAGTPAPLLRWWEMTGSQQLGEKRTVQDTLLRPPPPVGPTPPSATTEPRPDSTTASPWHQRPEIARGISPGSGTQRPAANQEWWKQGIPPTGPGSEPPIPGPRDDEPLILVGKALLYSLLAGTVAAVVFALLGAPAAAIAVFGSIAALITFSVRLAGK